MNFRKLKKLLKKDMVDKRFTKVTCCQVSIRFSKEISYWGKEYYHENLKFWEYWDTFNRRKSEKKYGNDVWRVAYQSVKHEKLAEEGKLDTSILRYLVCNDSCVMLNANGIGALIICRPSEYYMTVRYYLSALYKAMDECAKFCGGSVEFTYTEEQRLPFQRKAYKTLRLGKEAGDECG